VKLPEMEYDFLISAATQNGVKQLMQKVGNLVEQERAKLDIDYNRQNYVNQKFLASVISRDSTEPVTSDAAGGSSQEVDENPVDK